MLTLATMRTELVKSLRRPRTYVAYGILMLIPIIMAVAIDLNPPDAGGRGPPARTWRHRPGCCCPGSRCGSPARSCSWSWSRCSAGTPSPAKRAGATSATS